MSRLLGEITIPQEMSGHQNVVEAVIKAAFPSVEFQILVEDIKGALNIMILASVNSLGLNDQLIRDIEDTIHQRTQQQRKVNVETFEGNMAA